MSDQAGNWKCEACAADCKELWNFCPLCSNARPEQNPEVKAAVSEEDVRFARALCVVYLGNRHDAQMPWSAYSLIERRTWLNVLAKAREILGVEKLRVERDELQRKLADYENRFNVLDDSNYRRQDRIVRLRRALHSQADSLKYWVRKADELQRKLEAQEQAKPSGLPAVGHVREIRCAGVVVWAHHHGTPAPSSVEVEVITAYKPAAQPSTPATPETAFCHCDEADLGAAKVRRETCPEHGSMKELERLRRGPSPAEAVAFRRENAARKNGTAEQTAPTRTTNQTDEPKGPTT